MAHMHSSVPMTPKTRYPLGMATLATSEDSTVTTNSSGSSATDHPTTGCTLKDVTSSARSPGCPQARSPAQRFRQLFARTRTSLASRAVQHSPEMMPRHASTPSSATVVTHHQSTRYASKSVTSGSRDSQSPDTRSRASFASHQSTSVGASSPQSTHVSPPDTTVVHVYSPVGSPNPSVTTASPNPSARSRRDWHFFPFFSSKASSSAASKQKENRTPSVDPPSSTEITTSNRKRLGIPKLTIKEASMDEDDGDPVNTDHGVVPQYSSTQTTPATTTVYHATTDNALSDLQPPIKASPRPSLIAEAGSSRYNSFDSGYQPQTSAALPKMSTGSASSRFMWKLKPKTMSTQSASSQSSDSAWKSTESSSHMTWRSAEGGEYVLKGTRLEYLTQFERSALQKIAFQRLQKANLNCNVQKPKDSIQFNAKTKRQKQFKGQRANTVTVVDKKMPPPSNTQVFGIPIQQCIANDQRAQLNTDTDNIRCKSLDEPLEVNMAAACALQPTSTTGSRLSVPKLSLTPRLSQSSIRSSHSDDAAPGPRSPMVRSASPGGLQWVTTRHSSLQSPDPAQRRQSSTQSQASNASNEGSDGRCHMSNDNLLAPHSPVRLEQARGSSTSIHSQGADAIPLRNPQVPKIVETCTDYLKKHVGTVGLFRKPGNVNRCRKLRVELDSGQEIIVTDGDEDEADIRPHDIAALLKEYFRDLPHPLMTAEMYPVCVALGHAALQGVYNEEQCLELLGYIIAMLPSANSDTLLVLMRFLEEVTNAADDQIGPDGETIVQTGNKMNSYNLATIFAPSIIRQADSGKSPFATDLGDNDAVIKVVELMINNVDRIFTITKELQSSMYQMLHETEPEMFDNLLYKLCQQFTLPGDEEARNASGTLFCETLREDTHDPEVTRDADGTMIIKYRHDVTHRIVYRAPQQRFDLDAMVAGCAAATQNAEAALAQQRSLLHDSRKSQSEGELQVDMDMQAASTSQTGASRVNVYASDPSKLDSMHQHHPSGTPGRGTMATSTMVERSSSSDGRAMDMRAVMHDEVALSASAPQHCVLNTASEVTTLPTNETQIIRSHTRGRSPSPNTVGGKRSKATTWMSGGASQPLTTSGGNGSGGAGAVTEPTQPAPTTQTRRHRFLGHIGDVLSKSRFVK